MAAKLLPLWELLHQLSTSTSAAPQEVTAVVDQIQATMSPDQMNAINSMQFTQADILSVFQQQGSTNGSGGTATAGGTRPSGGTGSNRGNGGGQNFFFGGGGAPGEGFPGGGTRNGGARTTQTPSQSTSAQRAQTLSNGTSTILVNEIIRLLESKITS
jgi:hypothetical protein